MIRSDDLLSEMTRRRIQGSAPEHTVEMLVDPASTALLTQAQRLEVWRKAWWYDRDPRIALCLRDSGCWDDAALAQQLLAGSRDYHLLSPDLMELSCLASRQVSVETWHGRAIAQVSDLGLDASTRFLWAAVHALPPSPDRLSRAMLFDWPDPVAKQAVEIVVNKWFLSRSEHLEGKMVVWQSWLAAAPARLRYFGQALAKRVSYETDKAYSDEGKQDVARLSSAMRRFLLESTPQSQASSPAAPRQM